MVKKRKRIDKKPKHKEKKNNHKKKRGLDSSSKHTKNLKIKKQVKNQTAKS